MANLIDVLRHSTTWNHQAVGAKKQGSTGSIKVAHCNKGRCTYCTLSDPRGRQIVSRTNSALRWSFPVCSFQLHGEHSCACLPAQLVENVILNREQAGKSVTECLTICYRQRQPLRWTPRRKIISTPITWDYVSSEPGYEVNVLHVISAPNSHQRNTNYREPLMQAFRPTK